MYLASTQWEYQYRDIPNSKTRDREFAGMMSLTSVGRNYGIYKKKDDRNA